MPPVVVTNGLNAPALAPPPVTAVISVGETTLTLVAAMAPVVPLPWPITTLAPVTKPVPVMVMPVPPFVGPVFGLTFVTVGSFAVTVSISEPQELVDELL